MTVPVARPRLGGDVHEDPQRFARGRTDHRMRFAPQGADFAFQCVKCRTREAEDLRTAINQINTMLISTISRS